MTHIAHIRHIFNSNSDPSRRLALLYQNDTIINMIQTSLCPFLKHLVCHNWKKYIENITYCKTCLHRSPKDIGF